MTRSGPDRSNAARVGPAVFGVLLRGHRERAWLSRRELAQRCGLSVRTIFNLEQGRVRSPRGDSVRLLADALELRGDERDRFEDAARSSLAATEPVPSLTAPVSTAPAEPGFLPTGQLRPR